MTILTGKDSVRKTTSAGHGGGKAARMRLTQQLRQLGDIRRDPPRLSGNYGSLTCPFVARAHSK
jgi:hypothetical protein